MKQPTGLREKIQILEIEFGVVAIKAGWVKPWQFWKKLK
jgi:hypothetical protein